MGRAVSTLTGRVLDSIRRHELFRGGDAVLVAVSGGADSIALLDLLRALASRLGLTLDCAHVHHGLRSEADADADFVRGVCQTLGVPFHLDRVSVRREPPWEGLEAEARRARHAALESRARALGAARIATGHTADDQAETVLMRLLAGAGPRGLAGIAWQRDPFVRPLLATRRAEILDHLRSRGLEWREDATNRDPSFLRNRLRHDVLPHLARVLGADVTAGLCRTASLCRRLVTDLDRHAEAELARVATRNPAGFVLPVQELLARPDELAAEMLFTAAAALGDARPRRAATHRAVRRLLHAETPRRAVTFGPLSVERSGKWLRVGPTRLAALDEGVLPVPGSVDLPGVVLRLSARRFDRPFDYAPPRDPRRVAFDADLLPDALAVRRRRPGDRFTPFGGQGERRLKTFFIDAGVPRWERPRVPLLEAAGDIIWVAGVRRGSGAPVSKDTRRILEVTLDFL